MERIYLDYNASTPLEPAVVEALRGLLERDFGNPSSSHWAGRPAKEAIEAARVQVAKFLRAEPADVVFTSGGTEASNHAIQGIWFARQFHPAAFPRVTGPGHFITTAVEHPATLAPLRFLERLGARVTVVPVDRLGQVDPAAIEASIEPDTLLVSVMHANNEVGTLQPVEAISRITRKHGVAFHVDAAQSVGKVPVRVDELGCDLLSVAGHKLHAPKGVGVLYLREGIRIEPFVRGASHENGRRAGTENLFLDVALGAACEVAEERLRSSGPGTPTDMRRLRDRLEAGLAERLGSRVSFNGHRSERLPNTSSVNFIGRIGADVLAAMPQIAASTGSACHAGKIELSGVLAAMGVPPEEGMGAVRFSLGRPTTDAEIDRALDLVSAALS